MKLPTALFAFVAVLVLGLTAAVAVAGGPGTPKLTAAKKKGGPYARELRVNVGDQGRRVFVKVRSTYDAKQRATLREGRVGSGDPDLDWNVKWFRGENDVSHDVQTSGHEFGLRPGKSKLFKVKVKAIADSPDPFCLYSQVEVDLPTTGTAGPFIAVNGSPDPLCEP